jgi:hypothetical protein
VSGRLQLLHHQHQRPSLRQSQLRRPQPGVQYYKKFSFITVDEAK